ncbi:MAG: AAA domain-containing protein [Myxococcales bacterium]
MAPPDFTLERLKALWLRERLATRERFRQERSTLSLAERVERGLALEDLHVSDAEAVAGGRLRLWLETRGSIDLDDVRISNGEPVSLWWQAPDEPEAISAVVSRRARGKLALVVDGDVPERIWDGGFQLDREAPESTFDRGERAITRLIAARTGSPEAILREALLRGTSKLSQASEPTFLDGELNPPQRVAVSLALAAAPLSLIHGPPGTGKTRTLVEVIRQCVQRGERVLVTAASNTAVDNLAERLIAHRVPLVRLGHPARVSPEVEGATLDALVEVSDASKLARTWNREAEQLRRTADKRLARGAITYRERRGMLQEASRLIGDARALLASAQDLVLAQAKVICATCAGADSKLMQRFPVDRVVIDEATQAPDPMSLIALLKAPKAVLAGDPMQLPPTVIDEEAAHNGLASTWFERVATMQPELVALLRVQHRMHETLMHFPSQSMYQGQLLATPSVAQHTLEELGMRPDSLRPGVLVFIDSAGRGWEEEHASNDPSSRNPQQAERAAAELKRLLRRGLAPDQVAVITPYEAQARLLRSLLAEERGQGLEIGTVDGFQGREKEAIIVDLVRSNPDRALGFLTDIRRMNVALTRAKRFLLVLGDSATLGGHDYYDAFLRTVEREGTWVSAWADDPDEELSKQTP